MPDAEAGDREAEQARVEPEDVGVGGARVGGGQRRRLRRRAWHGQRERRGEPEREEEGQPGTGPGTP
ncbi:hypothetical protein GCM10023340_10720 [Nocardioides marinquilinus]|uniref:Uncharacterized protein n=1 Tax=Nocardioides marinquilinus TaxID=1210400 RepID=A0ABP9PF59_9ACTN